MKWIKLKVNPEKDSFEFVRIDHIVALRVIASSNDLVQVKLTFINGTHNEYWATQEALANFLPPDSIIE